MGLVLPTTVLRSLIFVRRCSFNLAPIYLFPTSQIYCFRPWLGLFLYLRGICYVTHLMSNQLCPTGRGENIPTWLESNPRQGVVIASDRRQVQELNRDQPTLFAADDLGADSFVAEKVIIGSVAALVAWTDKKRRNWSKWKREKKKRGKK